MKMAVKEAMMASNVGLHRFLYTMIEALMFSSKGL